VIKPIIAAPFYRTVPGIPPGRHHMGHDDMNWFDWTLIAWLALGVLSAIALIGKPRKPITPGVAVTTLVINGALAAGVVLCR
jgi:hypothetical protein